MSRDWGFWQVVLAIIAIVIPLAGIHGFSPTTGSISVASSPNGASIYLDNTYEGETPKILENINSGSHTITLKLAGYKEYSHTASVDADGETSISADLVQTPTPTDTAGNISVASSPNGASIYLDDAYEGETPKIIENVEQGSHIITLKLEGYEKCSRTANVEASKQIPILATLTPIEPISSIGNISVSSFPEGASIYLDDSYEGETPKIIEEVEQGSHIITLKLVGYDNWSQHISVDPGKTFSLSPTLTSNPLQEDNTPQEDNTLTPSAEIGYVWLESDVWENYLKGVKIHVTFNVENLEDQECIAIASFYNNLNGVELTDSDGDYAIDGKVAVWEYFTPEYVDSSYSDFTLFIPYDQFHYVGQGNAYVKYFVTIGSEENGALDVSDWYTFSFVKYS